MTITGKKFSQLTQEQQIATRVPITGWLVNNLFVNPTAHLLLFRENQSVEFSGSDRIQLITGGTTCYIPSTPEVEIGFVIYFINWGTNYSSFTGSEGVTIVGYNLIACGNVFGVFKAEKTGVDEWTFSVIENGTIGED